ncbi:Gfo/Idh/MocA family protein [Streptococcus zalophi]|uniref:Gfo/Idh/MocA family oxidoreductase n=1 Tax=Streptococcus zalophi TaxID=640031 RepID=A0A934P9V3_9STRE|nr:Gfo/Idh/MocA family oxidoreductase [Streptococcus zalophi]MBJ8349687.1 Gfo/Idh/MocA family oxidoreductase [Streptococcus zalophi]MCR8967964.1 Gfo/Idh/MocA family oxidoreductase [Streptococcus zalophi]
MKLAIIGTGMIVKEVLPVLKTIDGIDLEMIVSTSRSIKLAEALSQEYGIKTFTSQYQEVLDSDTIDTVYIAVPNHLHFDFARKALMANKHVICEKPFTMTAQELEDLSQLANERQLILLEAITNQYLENYTYIKELLPKVGDVKIITCNFSQYSSRYDAFKKGEIAPVFDPEKGGGALRDLNVYNIHFVVGLFGLPKSVHYLANMEKGIDTSGILLLDYQTFKVSCIGSKDSSADIKTTIQGNKGYLEINGATSIIPSVALTLNGEKTSLINKNSNQPRLWSEFVAFEEIIRLKDLKEAKQRLKHSRQVMEVLEQALATTV